MASYFRPPPPLLPPPSTSQAAELGELESTLLHTLLVGAGMRLRAADPAALRVSAVVVVGGGGGAGGFGESDIGACFRMWRK